MVILLFEIQLYNSLLIFLKNLKKILDKLSYLYYYLKVSNKSGCSAVGSARGLGPWGREFESLHPDH